MEGTSSDVAPAVDIEVLGLSLTLSPPGLDASGLIRDGATRGMPGDMGEDEVVGIMDPPAAKAAKEGGGASGTVLFGGIRSFVSVG